MKKPRSKFKNLKIEKMVNREDLIFGINNYIK